MGENISDGAPLVDISAGLGFQPGARLAHYFIKSKDSIRKKPRYDKGIENPRQTGLFYHHLLAHAIRIDQVLNTAKDKWNKV